MKMLSYERLSRIVKDIKPYRKTKNSKDNRDRYPLDWRKHGYKCFFVTQDANGDNEYHITYGLRYVEKSITKERHDELIAKNGYGARDRGNGMYSEWVTEWNTIGIVRKDNTLEFTNDRMHQGTRYFMANMMGKYHSEIVSSVKHGGTIYREYERDEDKNIKSPRAYGSHYKDTTVIPMFKGQRINIETNRSVINYEVHLPYVNRERSREVMAEYKEGLKVADVFFKTMSSEVFASELADTYNEVFADNKPNWRNAEATDKLHEYAMTQVKTDIYKGMYAVMMLSGVSNAWNIASGSPYYDRSKLFPHQYFSNAKYKFYKFLKVNNDVLDNKVYKANEAYPSNSWIIKILVDGKQVEAY